MHALRHCSLILFVLIPGFCLGQSPVAPLLGSQLSPKWRITCQEALKTPLPTPPPATPGSDSASQSAMAYYYGFWGWKLDLTAARKVAWQERSLSSADPGSENPFRGSLILAMIYANGSGTPRDTALALRMGCEATAYRDGLKDADLDRLQAALTSPADPSSSDNVCHAVTRYDVCNAAPPEVKNVALCAHFDSLMNRQRVISSIAELSADWTVEQKRLMKEVEDTEDRFSRSYSRLEAPLQANDDGPSGSDAFHLRQKSEFDDAFLGRLRWMCVQKAVNRNAGRDNRNAALLDVSLNGQYHYCPVKSRRESVGCHQ
jgi:hypothetical protein